jgi:hypothetical protein
VQLDLTRVCVVHQPEAQDAVFDLFGSHLVSVQATRIAVSSPSLNAPSTNTMLFIVQSGAFRQSGPPASNMQLLHQLPFTAVMTRPLTM